MAEGITDKEFAEFCEDKSEVGAIPGGVINLITGKIIWISGRGEQLSGPQYKKKYGFDPAPVWERIQKLNAAKKVEQQYHVPEVKVVAVRPPKKVYKQLSTLPQFRQ